MLAVRDQCAHIARVSVIGESALGTKLFVVRITDVSGLANIFLFLLLINDFNEFYQCFLNIKNDLYLYLSTLLFFFFVFVFEKKNFVCFLTIVHKQLNRILILTNMMNQNSNMWATCTAMKWLAASYC